FLRLLGKQRWLRARFLAQLVNTALLALEVFLDRIQSLVNIIALGLDLLLGEGLRLPDNLQSEPAIRRQINDLRLQLRIRHIAVVRNAEAILDFIAFLDLAAELKHMPRAGLNRALALQGNLLALHGAVADPIFKLRRANPHIISQQPI